MSGIGVARVAVQQDLDRLVDLKIEWAGRVADSAERGELKRALGVWLDRDDVVCAVAEHGGELVGMGWMVLFDRVPDLANTIRRSADVQSVFVTPQHRAQGVGMSIVRLLCNEADRRAIPRVTVHSSPRAVDLYRRAGFAPSTDLLQREL